MHHLAAQLAARGGARGHVGGGRVRSALAEFARGICSGGWGGGGRVAPAMIVRPSRDNTRRLPCGLVVELACITS